MGINENQIKPTRDKIGSFLSDLLKKKYQIPTFQREVVWERENVKKLWDSIYKFYPLGSILIWKTDTKLQQHKSIGGFELESDDIAEYQYILDGQQRTTSLLTSIYGGKIKNLEDFNPTLYIDLTIELESEVDDESYKKRFLYWNEIDDQGGKVKQNIGRRKRYREGLIVPLQKIMEQFAEVDEKLQESGYTSYKCTEKQNLMRIKTVLDNYEVSIIELKGISVSEVCQIFERINQAGQPLDIFDIVVAKTFRLKTEDDEGFYLRELIDNFRDNIGGEFAQKIDNETIIQMLSMIINYEYPDSDIKNITPTYLNKLESYQIENVWNYATKAITRLFKFFDQHLYLKGPKLIPYRYFYITMADYLYKIDTPDYDFLKKYFWFYSFHNDDLLRNTTLMWEHLNQLRNIKDEGFYQFPSFVIDLNNLRNAKYSSRGRLSRAILSLYANQKPKDWKNPDVDVLQNVYYEFTDKPNLHHVFPVDYIRNNPGSNGMDVDSMMNIVYLPQLTNLNISNKNPVDYIKKYDCSKFREILSSHLLNEELLEWAKDEELPPDALDRFIEIRVNNIINILKNKLGNDIIFKIIDTGTEKNNNSEVVQ